MIEIRYNGNPFKVAENTTLAAFIEAQALQNKRIAVEVNQAIVPRSLYAEAVLEPNDQLEIIDAIGGG